MQASQVGFIAVDSIIMSPLSDKTTVEMGEQVVVAPTKNHQYQLLSGGEHLREWMEHGYTCVQVVINPMQHLEERIDRLLAMMVCGKLNPVVEAQSYQELLQSGLTTAQLALRVGRTQATIRKKMRLLQLDETVIDQLKAGLLCEKHGHELLRLPGAQGQRRVLAHVIEKSLSVQETKQLLDQILSRMPIPVANGRRIKPLMRDYRLYVNAISGIVEQMTDMGMETDMEVIVGKRVAEVRIVIPFGTKQRKSSLR